MKSCRPERVKDGRDRTENAAGAPVRSAGRADRIRVDPEHPRSAVSVRLAERVPAHRGPTMVLEPSDPAASPALRPNGRRRLPLPSQPPRPVRHNRLPPSDRSPRRTPRHDRNARPPRSATSHQPSDRGLRPRLDRLVPPRLRPLPSRQRLRPRCSGRLRTSRPRRSASAPAAPTTPRIPTARAASGRRRSNRPFPQRLRRPPNPRRPRQGPPLLPLRRRQPLLLQRPLRRPPAPSRHLPFRERPSSRCPDGPLLSRRLPVRCSLWIRRGSASRICAASAVSGGTAIG